MINNDIKRVIGVFLAVSLFLCYTPLVLSANSGTLKASAYFETGSLGDCANNGGSSSVAVSGGYNGSNYAMQVAMSTSPAWFYFNSFKNKMVAGHSYAFSAYIKLLPYNSGGTDYNTRASCLLAPYYTNTTGSTNWHEGTINTGVVLDSSLNTYQHVQIVYTYPLNGSNTYNFFMFGCSKSIAAGMSESVFSKYLIDNIEVYEVEKPVVTQSVPVNNGEMSVSSSVYVSFNTDMDEGTITNTANYKLNGSSDNISSITKQPDGSYSISFINELAEKSNYTLLLTGLKDIWGQKLSDYTLNFNTLEKNVPVILSSVPASGEYNVELNSDLVVEYDSDLDFTTINTSNITVNGRTDLIDKIVTSDLNKNYITIKFKNLVYSTYYSVLLSNIKNMMGKSLTKTISFTTIDKERVVIADLNNNIVNSAFVMNKVSKSTENDGSTKYTAEANGMLDFKNILKENTTYDISFKIKMDASTPNLKTVQVAAYYLYDTGINDIDEIATAGADDFVNCHYTYTVQAGYQFSTEYSIILRALNAGNFYLKDFKIIELNPAALLLKSYPVSGQRDVPVNSELNMVFSYGIDTAKLTASNISVKDFDDNSVAIKSILPDSEDPHKFSIILNETLKRETGYTITTNLVDTFGRIVPETISTFFTTTKYSVESFGIYENYGTASMKEITGKTLKPGEITADVYNLKNNSDVNGSAVVIIALYKDNKMIDSQFAKQEIGAGSIQMLPLTAKLTVPDLSDGNYCLKAFLWEKFDNIRPIVKEISAYE